MFKKTLFSIIAATALLTSVTYADGYVVSSYGQVIQSDPGVIVGRQWVQYRRGGGNAEGAGTAIGAVTGGVVGSTMGRGSGHIVGALGGAVLGGLLGNAVGRNVEHQHTYDAIQYTVRLANGNLLTIMESPDVNLPRGLNVLVERSSDGRCFIIPQ